MTIIPEIPPEREVEPSQVPKHRGEAEDTFRHTLEEVSDILIAQQPKPLKKEWSLPTHTESKEGGTGQTGQIAPAPFEQQFEMSDST